MGRTHNSAQMNRCRMVAGLPSLYTRVTFRWGQPPMTDTLKTRLLRRYEADADICSTDAGDPTLGFYSPFGPLIAKAEVPLALVDRLNAFADTIVSDGKGM